MKIFYDHYALSYLKFGGISKYICELLRHIPKENRYTSTLFSNNQDLQDSGLVKAIKLFPGHNFRGQGRIMTELNMPYTKYKLHTAKWDVFHATWFATPYYNDVKNKPVVVTIHDLIYDVFYKNQDVLHREKMIDMGKRSANRADKIIAISQCTKEDMIREWGIDGAKIEVIYHGVDKVKYSLSETRLLDDPYIFFAGGSRGKNKNFEHLLKAFSIVSKKCKDLKLVCSGTPFTEGEIKELWRLKIFDKVSSLYATGQQMAQLYHDAEMLIVPSYYEGFGLPILEAMVYNCPVVLSNTSCLPEIAGKAGIYFDPYNIEEMSEQIFHLLFNPVLRARQKKLGQSRINDFSWEKCANQHLDVYNSLI